MSTQTEGGWSVITIVVTSELEYSITYHLEGVKCTSVLVRDLGLGLDEVRQKMQLEMGLAKGKTFTTKAGR